jgi:hypothetical protein
MKDKVMSCNKIFSIFVLFGKEVRKVNNFSLNVLYFDEIRLYIFSYGIFMNLYML